MTGKIRKSLRTNISTLYVLHFANLLLPLITLPYLLRVLGSANYGRMAFAYAFIAYFNVLCDFGFNLAAPRRVAQIRDDSATLGTFAMTVFVIKFALALVGFAIMMAVVLPVPGFRGTCRSICWLSRRLRLRCSRSGCSGPQQMAGSRCFRLPRVSSPCPAYSCS